MNVISQSNATRAHWFRNCCMAICALLVVCHEPASVLAEQPTSNDGIRIFTDVEYAAVGDHTLLLDLYLSEKVTEPPLVVWIHGGAWRRGSKASMPLINQSHELHAACKRSGVASHLEVVHDGAHGGDLFFDEARRELVLQFLAKLLQ